MEGSAWSSKAQLQTLVKNHGLLSRGAVFFCTGIKGSKRYLLTEKRWTIPEREWFAPDD
jgi:hypothetical protein